MFQLDNFIASVNILQTFLLISFGSEFFNYKNENFIVNISLWKKLGFIILYLNLLCVTISMVSYCYTEEIQLIQLLSLVMFFLLFLGSIYLSSILYLLRREFFCDALQKCEKLYHCESVFEQFYGGKIIQDAGKNALLLTKVFRFLVILAVTSALIFGTLLSFFTENKNFPLPYPMHIVGLKPKDGLTYAMNFISLSVGSCNAASFYVGTVTSSLVCAVYLLARFDIIVQLCKNMNIIVAESSFKEFSKLVMKHMLSIRE